MLGKPGLVLDCSLKTWIFLSKYGAEGREESPCGLAGVSLAGGLTKGALCGRGGRMPCGTAGPRVARPGLGRAGLGTQP